MLDFRVASVRVLLEASCFCVFDGWLIIHCVLVAVSVNPVQLFWGGSPLCWFFSSSGYNDEFCGGYVEFFEGSSLEVCGEFCCLVWHWLAQFGNREVEEVDVVFNMWVVWSYVFFGKWCSAVSGLSQFGQESYHLDADGFVAGHAQKTHCDSGRPVDDFDRDDSCVLVILIGVFPSLGVPVL